MKYLKIVFILVLACGSLHLSAQKRTTRHTETAKFKAPKLQTLLGNYKDSASVSVEAGSNAIALPLKITDDKNNVYTIVAYQFLYRKLGVTEDEQTEKITPTTSISSSYFTTTPLTPVWVNTIQKYLKPGEEFYFFDIVAKDAKGNNHLAPTLKITIR
ncbi:MAG: hypothetical protein ABI091_02030 [Ferruginibacter sp.]